MIIPVVLAGGSGTRLWPLSRQLYPKQLLRLTGDHTMIQNTLLRLADFDQTGPPMVIGNENQRFLVARQLADIHIRPSSIFLEPVGRNTAPAVAVAALQAVVQDPSALILILPADHLIADVPAFHEALRVAGEFADHDFLVTFGIVPDRPETGYGYIRRGRPASLSGESAETKNRAYAIREFVEKPDLETARQYLATGEYCWNSGMFMFKAETVLAELRRFVPEIVAACENAMDRRQVDKEQADQRFFYLDPGAFKACPSDSIDYAVMEKTDRGIMVPLDAGWDDVGSWEALWNIGEKDDAGNVVEGDVVCVDVKDSLIRSQSRLVTVLGVRNLAVVETADALLVSSLSGTQGVKKIVDTLKADRRKETRTFTLAVRSWGTIQTLEKGTDFHVRKMVVEPGQQLHSRVPGGDTKAGGTATWTIIAGSARVIATPSVDKSEPPQPVSLSDHQSHSVFLNQPVILENAGQVPLVLIEVATGRGSGNDRWQEI